MIRYFTERKLRAIFAAVSAGNFWPMIDALADRFVYRFEGDSPIGGVRTRRESMQLWWERMYRLFPGFSIVVRDVAVAGWPWDLRIHTRLEFRMPMQDGTIYRNDVMQLMRMRWGKVDDVHTIEDTQRCVRLLAWMAQQGKAEASAPPITDLPWPESGPFMGGKPAFASRPPQGHLGRPERSAGRPHLARDPALPVPTN
ncbi:nuclear transport factor 2 family protein [Caenimonas koreensis]|nr:nuclear transport factor 2 family protein [Caenimonas koreensis]